MRHLQEVIDEMRRSRRVTSSKTLIVLESWTAERAFPAGDLPGAALNRG
jgi:Lrp/AsnC family transcriptional regulator, leucine-responsive regulatory protein